MAGEQKAAGAGAFPGAFSVQAVWIGAPEVKPIFADQMQVTRVGDVYHLTFGQIQVGAGIKKEHGTQTAIEPVVRLVVSEDAMHRISALIEKVKKDWGSK